MSCEKCPFENHLAQGCCDEFYDANGFQCTKVPVYLNTGRRVYDEKT